MRADVAEARTASAVLTNGTLAAFSGGLSWVGILALTSGKRTGWWRQAIAEAEGRGVLEWDRDVMCWRLTAAGKALTKKIA